MTGMKYSEYRPLAKSGDALLFDGEGIVSEVIEIATWSGLSHIAMVTADPMYGVCSWESTAYPTVRDVEAKRFVNGSQLVPLSERLATYAGRVFVRPLLRPLDEQDWHMLQYTRRQFAGRPYERSLHELAMAACDLAVFPENQQNLDSLFCSEQFAEYFKRIRRIPETPASNERTPADFDEPKFSGVWGEKRELGFDMVLSEGAA